MRPGEPTDSTRPRQRHAWRVFPTRLAVGLGNLAAAFDVEQGEDGVDLLDPAGSLRLEPDDGAPFVILATPRVGVAYAGPGWADQPWRFVIGSRNRRP
jgi:DNA-3-methyladenine glycosylase